MTTQPHDTHGSLDLYRVNNVHRKRRYRAHAILGLIIFIAVVFVTLKTENFVSQRIRPASMNGTFNGDFDSISPYAKAKVALFGVMLIQCENIYSHKDQCKFVMTHCEESEVGMLHYLKFYFCTPEKATPIA